MLEEDVVEESVISFIRKQAPQCYGRLDVVVFYGGVTSPFSFQARHFQTHNLLEVFILEKIFFDFRLLRHLMQKLSL